jgi:hypothetical protein
MIIKRAADTSSGVSSQQCADTLLSWLLLWPWELVVAKPIGELTSQVTMADQPLAT